MIRDEETDQPEWSALTLDQLLNHEGILEGTALFEQAGIPEAPIPAERVIERLAALPHGTRHGKVELLDELLSESEDREGAVAEIIADAARKLGSLDWVLEEVLSEWQMSKWALTERLSALERDIHDCRERLASLPDSELAAPALRRAGRVAQEEFAGLIALLDGYRLAHRQDRNGGATDEVPAFIQESNVIRLLDSANRSATDRKAA